MRQGRFIVVEGGEGAGKSSGMKKLQLCLPPNRTVFTREPGGTPLAAKIRAMLLHEREEDGAAITLSPLTHFALFWAARRAHIEEIISPALKAGKDVICDRFDASTWAYQIWGQEQYQLIPVFQMMRDCFVVADAQPYLYVFLDVEVELGLLRTHTRGEQNDFDKKDVEFHRRVQRGYREFLARHACRIVDANRSEKEVSEDVIKIIQNALA